MATEKAIKARKEAQHAESMRRLDEIYVIALELKALLAGLSREPKQINRPASHLRGGKQ